jgi:thioredoxin 2
MSDTVHVVCAHCDSTVRLPEERLGEVAKCPKCHTALFEGKPVALTEGNFEQHISRNDLPVVVDFWAPWCGPPASRWRRTSRPPLASSNPRSDSPS